MNNYWDFTSLSWFNLLVLICIILLLIFTILNFIKIRNMKKEYKKLVELMGNGNNFNDMLIGYIDKVDVVSHETKKLKDRIENIEKNVEKCVQKVGVVRYNAYKNFGSDLCFAIALLDFEDNGVVINGIYSRDNTTTTYAKPIEHGKSSYTLVQEEEKAIEIAKHNGYKCFLDIK